jgi:hypothetical protein
MSFLELLEFFKYSGTVFQLILGGLFLSIVSVVLKFLKATYQVNFGIVNKNTNKTFGELTEKIDKAQSDISSIKEEIGAIKNSQLNLLNSIIFKKK